MSTPRVSVVMGSDSDLPVMKDAAEFLEGLGVVVEVAIVSAHRTPDILFDFARGAHERGIQVIIAGAGGAAHLPGMVAALSPLPVIGVPIESSNSIDGWDSVLSILQMPNGVPVATVALDAAKNAGILAAQILATHDAALQAKLLDYKRELRQAVEDKRGRLAAAGYKAYLAAKSCSGS
jgi:5-(carboxyamino)imidazole ribonucleotide mutase